MVFNAIYNWMFASDLLMFKPGENKKPIVLRVGDRISVYSERFNCWFDDGMVTATFRDRLTVKYGFKKYFGWALNRGNEKTITVANMREFVRPHKLFEVSPTLTAASGSLKLVAPAAAAGVKRRKLNSEPVVVKQTVGPADSLA